MIELWGVDVSKGRQKVARWALLLGLVALLVPASASAKWDSGKCELSGKDHCYNLQAWEMEGGSESVKGAQYYPTTSLIDVPEFASGAFVDDEMWVGFEEKEGGWVETGQEAGYDNAANCCTLRPFKAHALRASGYGYEEYVWTNVSAEPTNLYTVEDAEANGNWCVIIWYTNQGCESHPSYWTAYSDNLEGGIEAASETQPENVGSQEVNAFTHSGTHIEWKGAKKHAVKQLVNYKEESDSSVMCQTPNYESNYYGNDDWSIC